MSLISSIYRIKNNGLKNSLTKAKDYFRVITNRRRLSRIYLRNSFSDEVRLKTQSALFKYSKTYNVEFHSNPYHLNHQFNLLGSGWVDVGYHAEACGVHEFQYPNQNTELDIDPEGNWLSSILRKNHFFQAQSIWKLIQEINPSYKPIDWQRDFKSGFRFDAKVIYFKQRGLFEKGKGIDLKVPWELSRLQHIPQLLIQAHQENEQKEHLVKEGICQLLDFVMTNPVGMGVNFNCAMDVGIRMANMVVSIDLCKQIASDHMTPEIENILAQYLYQQMEFVLEELEYNNGNTSNHYLGNISGLLFASAYLSPTLLTNQALAFAIQELNTNVLRQFYEDGGNFESSINYHRLSAEMVLYSALLISSMEDQIQSRISHYSRQSWKYVAPLNSYEKNNFKNGLLQKDAIQRIASITQFMEAYRMPNEKSPQFGDNDSGRFLNLIPIGQVITHQEACNKYENLNDRYAQLYSKEDDHFDEDLLNHSACIELGYLLMGWIDQSIAFTPLQSLLSSYKGILKSPLPQMNYAIPSFELLDLEFNATHSFSNGFKPTSFHFYPESGLMIAKNDSSFIALSGIRNNKQQPSLGHSHNDKLSIELFVKGKYLTRDPGTYLYTPIPSWRNEFRCTAAHNTLRIEGLEQQRFFDGYNGLFRMEDDCKLTPIIISDTEFGFQLFYRDVKQQRLIKITDDQIIITDQSSHPFTVNFKNQILSNGYGKLLAKPSLN